MRQCCALAMHRSWVGTYRFGLHGQATEFCFFAIRSSIPSSRTCSHSPESDLPIYTNFITFCLANHSLHTRPLEDCHCLVILRLLDELHTVATLVQIGKLEVFFVWKVCERACLLRAKTGDTKRVPVTVQVEMKRVTR